MSEKYLKERNKTASWGETLLPHLERACYIKSETENKTTLIFPPVPLLMLSFNRVRTT